MARRTESVGVQVTPPPVASGRPRIDRVRQHPARPSLAVVHHTEGPRVRLGLVWLGAAFVALGVGRGALALLMGAAAAFAAGQLAATRSEVRVDRTRRRSTQEHWRELTRPETWLDPPTRLPASLLAFSLPLAAASGTATLTAALGVAVPVVAVYRLSMPGAVGSLADAGYAVAFGWAAGLAAAAPVLAYGVGADVALVLIVLVGAYDAGDYIVGSGASSPWEGPAAGIAAVLVLTFAATVVPPAPLDSGDVWLLGGLVCLLAPIGPPAGSVLLGDGTVPAGFVRRLDSLLVLGPVWAYVAAAIA